MTFGVYYEIVRIWSSVSVSRWDAGVEGGGSWGSTGDTFWEDVQRSVIYPIVQFFFWSFQVVEQGAANEPATGHSPHRRSRAGTVDIEWGVDGEGGHWYIIRGRICHRSSSHCDEDFADDVFDTVNRVDVPWSWEDLGPGEKILAGNNPIYHDEFPAERRSVNTTRKGHRYHRGEVVNQVVFGDDDFLYYEVIGTGTGKDPYENIVTGTLTFFPVVDDVVEWFDPYPTHPDYFKP